jgi:glycosyltransferase involved in cell wall biosynthesis
MKISFVIPAYNEEKNIGECVRSIHKSMNGIHEEYEIIVVDNNCTDRTKQIAEHAGARVVAEKRKGIVWARSAGLTASTGELIANIDADNRLPRQWAGWALGYFANDSDLRALSGPLYYYDASRWVKFWSTLFYLVGYAADQLIGIFGSSSMLQGGNYIVTRDAMNKIGGYDTTIEFYGEDVDIGRRIAKIGKVLWTFKLPINSSGRRMEAEGVLTMAFKYGLNYIWTTLLHRPFSQTYKDIRK